MLQHNPCWSKSQQSMGRKVAYIGDLDRSNYPDILLGEPSTDSPVPNIGQAKLLSLSQFECFDCNEVCDDPLDNDGDGLVGCARSRLCKWMLSVPVRSKIVPTRLTMMAMVVDCIDPDCYRSPDCPVPLAIEITGEQAFFEIWICWLRCRRC